MALPGHIKGHENKAVTPAQAGVQWLSGAEGHWNPACAGMTLWGTEHVYIHRNVGLRCANPTYIIGRIGHYRLPPKPALKSSRSRTPPMAA